MALLLTVPAKEAHAYVDPGTIGYIYQLILIAASAVVIMLATAKDKVVSILRSAFDFIKNLFRSSKG